MIVHPYKVLVGGGIILCVMKMLGVGVLPTWSWWEAIIPFWLALGAYTIHLMSKFIASYIAIVAIVEVLYQDYQQRNEPLQQEILLEED